MNRSMQSCIKSQELWAHEKGCMESGQAMSKVNAVGWLGCAGVCYHKKGYGSLSALGIAVLIKSCIGGSAVISAYHFTVEPPFRPSPSGTTPFGYAEWFVICIYAILAKFLFLMLVYIFLCVDFCVIFLVIFWGKE